MTDRTGPNLTACIVSVFALVVIGLGFLAPIAGVLYLALRMAGVIK